ncbi:MAG: glycosyltransferase family 2 protein [Desulfobacterales bacterium]|nr:glycosyltransferase family 2 protein [Desulfobacterales bacterium]
MSDTTQPLVSIGVAAYNRPAGLRCLLESLIAQTYNNIEIIISNDCSSVAEEIHNICQEFMRHDTRIRYFRQPLNFGLHDNQSFLLEQAKGEFYIWANDDDEYAPAFIEECIKAFDDDPNAVLACSQVYKKIISAGICHKQFFPIYPEENSPYQNIKLFMERTYSSILQGTHRIDTWRKVWYSVPFHDWEEIYWIIKIILTGNVAIVNKHLLYKGQDEEIYEDKPIKQFENATYEYTPCMRHCFHLIFSSQMNFWQKINIYKLVLFKMIHTYGYAEKIYIRNSMAKKIKYWMITHSFILLQPVTYWKELVSYPFRFGRHLLKSDGLKHDPQD